MIYETENKTVKIYDQDIFVDLICILNIYLTNTESDSSNSSLDNMPNIQTIIVCYKSLT